MPATLSENAASRRRKLFALAIVLSVAVHGLVAWAVHDVPLGHIDPRLLLDDSAVPIQLVDGGPSLEPLAADASTTPDRDKLADPAALGQAMLSKIVSPDAALRETLDGKATPPVRHPGAIDGTIDLDALAAGLAVQEQLLETAAGPSLKASPFTAVESVPPAVTTPDHAPPDTARALLATMTLGGQPVARSAMNTSPRREISSSPTPDLALPDYTGSTLASATRHDVPEHLDNDFDYTLNVYPASRGPDFFRVDIRGRRSLARLRTMAKDVVFLVDTSGSIAQPWVNGAMRGIRDSLSGLNAEDRFNIVLFDETPRFFSLGRNRPVDAQALADAGDFLAGTESQGYTDVNHALSRLLVRDVEPDRVYSLILISDGKPTRGVMDTRELINRITRDNNLNAGIYCVGIGTGQNQPLLDFLAYRNRGDCVFVKKTSGTAAAIRDLISRIRYPILKQVHLDAVGVSVTDVVPQALPDIHQAQRTVVYGRFDRASTPDLTIRVQGANHGQAYDFTFRRSLQQAEPGDETIASGWAFQKLHHLYSELLEAPDPKSVQKQIQTLRRTYKLKTLY